MGREALCSARIDKQTRRVKAHLGSTSLDFSGDVRFALPLREVRAAVAEGGWLRMETARGEIALELGNSAPLWAKAGTRVATNTVAVAAKRFMIVPPTD